MIRIGLLVMLLALSFGCTAAHTGSHISPDMSGDDVAVGGGAEIEDGNIVSLDLCEPRARNAPEVAGRKYVPIGSAPVDPSRYYDPETEILFYFAGDTPASVEFKKKGKISRADYWIPEGTVGVAEKKMVTVKGRTVHKVLRICKCANGVRQKNGGMFYVAINSSNVTKVVKKQSLKAEKKATVVMTGKEEECVTLDSIATTGGTAMFAGGIPLIVAGGPPAWIGGGLVVAGGYLFYNGFENKFSPEKKTKPVCKAIGGMVGATVGAVAGSNSVSDSNKSSEVAGGSNNGEDTTGPATPPPVP